MCACVYVCVCMCVRECVCVRVCVREWVCFECVGVGAHVFYKTIIHYSNAGVKSVQGTRTQTLFRLD